jgi:hypothetical protein
LEFTVPCSEAETDSSTYSEPLSESVPTVSTAIAVAAATLAALSTFSLFSFFSFFFSSFVLLSFDLPDSIDSTDFLLDGFSGFSS